MSVEVPEGWREATIADIATLSAGGTPKREIPEYYQGGNIPWVKSGELRNGTIFDTEEKITEEGLVNSSTKLIPANCQRQSKSEPNGSAKCCHFGVSEITA